jgi:1-acyl-sn-glycerol-3-phosphate acyltransferase
MALGVLALCGLSAGALLGAPWRRCGRRAFDSLELAVMRLYVRLWHGWSRAGPPPLPATGPAIVIANHQSHADAALLFAGCGRPLRFLQARERYEAVWRPLFRLSGCIPVSRGRPDLSAVRAALECLKRGDAVCLFPEGEISPAGPGRIAPGKPGAALLALRSRAPVFPVRIVGGPQSHSLLWSWLRPTRGVRVRFGPAVDLSDYYGRPITRQLLGEVTARLMQGVIDLAPPPAACGLARPLSRKRLAERTPSYEGHGDVRPR